MEHENADGALTVREPESLARGARLVRYRVVESGLPAMVDERLTIFDDGAVEFDERHRSRDSMWFELEEAELQRLRFALEQVPSRYWSRLPLAMLKAKLALHDAFTFNEFQTPDRLFELWRRRRRIAGDFRNPPPEIETLMKSLDAVRVEALRLHPR